ncbi:MAG: methyl-accepting chemotaxis protein, partial [Selenomonadaceae bacterium]|nr:methyl-accepting chemotaxis protein [Selenomonadaceae bacterium]
MKLEQKFFSLAVIMAAVIAFVCATSYYFASTDLRESVDRELRETAEKEAMDLNGWLKEKKAFSISSANVMTGFNGNMSVIKTKAMTSTIVSDKDILDLCVGLQDGYFYCYYAGDNTGKTDPTQRGWYKDTRAKGDTLFTDTYVDVNTGKLVVSVCTPIRANGQFIGANCVDLSLEVLTKQAQGIKYQNQGAGIIIESNGNILATSQLGEPAKKFGDIDGLGSHFDEMVSKGSGYIEATVNGEDMAFAYATVPETGWIVGVNVPTEFVFAHLGDLRFMFLIIIGIAFVLVFGICRVFSDKITKPVLQLEEYSIKMSKGDLTMSDVKITTSDEIGSLTRDFNTMKNNLRNLIAKMSSNSHQVASSAEQLTASSQQSADASGHVAETVNDISESVEKQMKNITSAKNNIDSV